MYSGLSVKWLAYYRCCLKFTWLLLLELLEWYCLTYELSCPPMSSGLSVKWLAYYRCWYLYYLSFTNYSQSFVVSFRGWRHLLLQGPFFVTEVCVYTVWGYQNLSMKIYANMWNSRVNHTCATWTKMRFVDKMRCLKPGFKWLDHILIRMTSGLCFVKTRLKTSNISDLACCYGLSFVHGGTLCP